MRLETERLYLRPLTERDCTAEYLSWLLDPEVNRYLEVRHVAQTMDTLRDFVRTVNNRDNEHLFGIFNKTNHRHIGNIKVGPIGRYQSVADVGLLIGARDCWGHGYATEAILAASRHAFENLGVHKLSAGMYAPNQSSFRTFLKAGYKQEGLRRRHYLLDGKHCDVIELGLIPADLQPPIQANLSKPS